MIEFDFLSIRTYISRVNFDTKDVGMDILLATVLLYIVELEFYDIDKEQSFIKVNDQQVNSFDIQIVSKSRKPKLIVSGFSRHISIRVGVSEGEYLDSQEIKDWQDLHTLRETLNDLFENPLIEELIYCKDKLIGSNCFIRYSLSGTDDLYKFSKRLGMCMPWNKRVEKVVYDPWNKS